MNRSFTLVAVFVFSILVTGIVNAEQPKDGYSNVTLSDRSTYKGNFKNGLFNGKGTLIKQDGAKYEGEFKDGVFVKGKLMQTEENGSRDEYEGELKDGKGKGVITTKDGTVVKYEGGFKNYERNGSGKSVVKYIDGRTSENEGEFKDNVLVKGKMIVKKDGLVNEAEGEFKDNMLKKGKLLYIAKDDAKIIDAGEFKDFQLDGEGKRIVTYKNGSISELEGEFKNGGFVKGKTITIIDGIREEKEGEFKDGVIVETKSDAELAVFWAKEQPILNQKISHNKILKIKGLYIGMNIDEACKVVNALTGSPHIVVFGESFGPTTEKQYRVATVGSDNGMGAFMESPKVYAGTDKKVRYISFSSLDVDKFFNVSGISGEDFATEFMNAYKIPSMPAYQPFYDHTYDGTEIVIPGGWAFSSADGYKVTVTQEKAITIEAIAKRSEIAFD